MSSHTVSVQLSWENPGSLTGTLFLPADLGSKLQGGGKDAGKGALEVGQGPNEGRILQAWSLHTWALIQAARKLFSPCYTGPCNATCKCMQMRCTRSLRLGREKWKTQCQGEPSKPKPSWQALLAIKLCPNPLATQLKGGRGQQMGRAPSPALLKHRPPTPRHLGALDLGHHPLPTRPWHSCKKDLLSTDPAEMSVSNGSSWPH